MAVTSSGDARKFMVLRLPSLRPGKLRLYDVKMALFSSLGTSSVRFHCPMQGPQALARTVLPASEKVSSTPSRSTVARICSLPGVTKKSATGFRPANAFSLIGILEGGKRSGKIGGERAVDVRLELGQVDFDDLVVLGALVGLQEVVRTGRAPDGVGLNSDRSAEGRSEVRVVGRGSVREDTGCSTNFGALKP